MQAVLIDTREPVDVQELTFDVPTVVTTLTAGDVMVTCDDGKTIVIERKTPSDLLGSIKDGRLFQQCHKMRELSEFCYVAIIGRMDVVKGGKVRTDGYHITNWNWDSVQGALLTVQEMGVSVIYASDFKSCVERLARRDRDGLTIPPRRQSEPMTKAEAFLASLPGIGAMKAKRLLGYGPACWGLHWLTDNRPDHAEHNAKIASASPRQKQKIREILGLGECEFLSIREWESENDESAE